MNDNIFELSDAACDLWGDLETLLSYRSPESEQVKNLIARHVARRGWQSAIEMLLELAFAYAGLAELQHCLAQTRVADISEAPLMERSVRSNAMSAVMMQNITAIRERHNRVAAILNEVPEPHSSQAVAG